MKLPVMRNDDDLGELLDSIDVESWLDSQGIDYRVGRGSSGRQLNIRTCPTCGSDQWKTYLNADSGLGNCFAGGHPPGETFNKWKYIRAHLNEANGRQVIEHIKAHVEGRGWIAKRTTSVIVQTPVELKLPDSFALPHGGQNISYLVNRGITDAVTAYFHLRYCHKGWFGYTLDGQEKWMKFDERVLIPVFDLDGKMVNFQGRDITGTQEPKYLFPPGLSSTGQHLLNGMNVKSTKRIAIGEGAFDIAALKLALDGDAALRDVIPVATFGKHLSFGSPESQESKFAVLRDRGVEEATFFWDGTIDATDAAVKAGFLLKKLGLRVRVAMLPPDLDPNEVPASVVREAFYQATPLTMPSAVLIMTKRRRMNAR